ncbi:hypothetical protein [Azohydromonas aeria]|uniref:hypothetical protein n=1 Tax=Azohydromonas aeria TaxID=2590212 RepID=UPI0012FA580F|nr:hypothetical protein [Azohydromonas aeria]
MLITKMAACCPAAMCGLTQVNPKAVYFPQAPGSGRQEYRPWLKFMSDIQLITGL